MKDGWFFVKNNEEQKTMEWSSLKCWKKNKKKNLLYQHLCGMKSYFKNESEIDIYRLMKAGKFVADRPIL